MQINKALYLARIIMAFSIGILFIISYFLEDKNDFFNFIAYFPRKRKGSIKAGSLIFGIIFIIIAIYHCFMIF